MADPDLLYINIDQKYETEATSADIAVSIRGESFFSGDEALKRAREVARLVEDLRSVGVQDGEIQLASVSATVKNGVFSSSSEAKYLLNIVCADLSKFADILGAITSQKNATLRTVSWNYSNEDEAKDTALTTALAKSRQKADMIAKALNVNVGGVHTFTEELTDIGPQHHYSAVMDYIESGARVKAAKVNKEELGMEVVHKKKMLLKAKVKFHILGKEA